ncbi:MAG: FHA domain-containing protein, partial [Butyrivibrio sp.]|nr:FHA domain-containing protein [Butyrivibrio sp.]
TVFEDREIGAEDMRKLVKTLKKACDAVGEFLLDLDGIVLEPNMIFTDAERSRFMLCYFSGKKTGFEEDIKSLFEYVMGRLCHSDGEAVTIAYGIYKRINNGENSPSKLFELEERCKSQVCETVEERTEVREVIPEEVYSEEEREDRRPFYAMYALAGIAGIGFVLFLAGAVLPNFAPLGMNGAGCAGGCVIIGAAAFLGYKWFDSHRDGFIRVTTVRTKIPFEKKEVRIIVPDKSGEEDNLTVVLSGDAQGAHYLRWEDISGAHKYEIGERAVIVGCDAKKADCTIRLPGISRMHARISKEDDAYYIKDLNSTNGTVVDGRELSCFELCPINAGSKIILGNVECVFI